MFVVYIVMILEKIYHSSEKAVVLWNGGGMEINIVKEFLDCAWRVREHGEAVARLLERRHNMT